MVELDRILEWKQIYQDIYQMAIHEQHYIFRPLGREEYKQIIMMNLDLGEFQEIICQQAILYPENMDFSKGIAGIAEVLSDAILDASGLLIGQAPQLLEEFRAEMMNFDYQADCVIHEAFPEFSLEEIATWSIRKTMFYLSRAEWILRTLKGIPIEYLHEMEEQEAVPQQPPKAPAAPAPQKPAEPPAQPREEGQAAQSEEEVLAMLAASGAKVSKPITDLNKEVLPELNWFSYLDELKGEFD